MKSAKHSIQINWKVRTKKKGSTLPNVGTTNNDFYYRCSGTPEEVLETKATYLNSQFVGLSTIKEKNKNIKTYTETKKEHINKHLEL